jgi:hypothetical protein
MKERYTRELPPSDQHDPLAELARLIGQNDPFAGTVRQEKRAATEAIIDTDSRPDMVSVHSFAHKESLRRMIRDYGPTIAREAGYRAVEDELSLFAVARKLNQSLLDFKPGPIESFRPV